jgi:hypothetical protein
MRIPHQPQLFFGCTPVTQVELNPKSRDRIVPILRGLQHIYSQPRLRDRALDLIAKDIGEGIDLNDGRPGLTLWQIFVLASVRLGCDFTYDHLQDLAENHLNLRQIMQVTEHWKNEAFGFRRIRDNICRVSPETIEKINQLVVAEGHQLDPSAVETVRGDSFVAETNIHHPTESTLILDGLNKILTLAPQLAGLLGLDGWRQHKSLWKKAKKAGREIGRVSGDEAKLAAAYQKLFHVAEIVLPRTQEVLDYTLKFPVSDLDPLLAAEVRALLEELVYWHAATVHVCSTAYRRVVQGETVPNPDKLFSLFEPDTELIKRGKAAKPVEFGHKVLVIEDAIGFICHYSIIPLATDEREILIPEMKELCGRVKGRIRRASFDRGFHSPSNQQELKKLVAHPCLPKPGAKQALEQESQATVEFRQARQSHPGIESAIGALQSGNGLARCRDHSQLGYARYIGLGVLGRNLLVLGKLLLSEEQPGCLAAASLRAA